jgi:hypothetical protein
VKFYDKFQEAAYKERLAFDNLVRLYNLFSKEKYSILKTPYDGMDEYDVLVQRHTKGSIERRFIIELKIRMLSGDALQQAETDGYIFESKKYNSLKRIRDIDAAYNVALYISFTPTGTYMWNINELEEKGLLKPIKKEMNKATMNSRDDKANKKVYLLKKEWAKDWSYIWSEDQFNRCLAEKEIEKQSIKEQLMADKNLLEKVLFG